MPRGGSVWRSKADRRVGIQDKPSGFEWRTELLHLLVTERTSTINWWNRMEERGAARWRECGE